MGTGALEVNKESGSREPGFGCPGKGLTLLHIFSHKFSDIYCLDRLFLAQVFHPVFEHGQAEVTANRYIRDLPNGDFFTTLQILRSMECNI